MSHETWMIIAACFLALAVTLAVVAAVVYRRLDIREVRDFRSGRAASKEIEELRSIRAGSWRAGILAQQPVDIDSGPDDESDLQFRSIKESANRPIVSTDEAVTTLKVLDTPDQASLEPVDEMPTSLAKSPVPPQPSATDVHELPTTLKTGSRSR